MINKKHVLKVSAAWVSIVYIVCYAGVAFFPGIREWFMLYALHTTTNLGDNIMTTTTFIYGLVIWNIIAYLVVSLFAYLYNRIKA